MPTPNSIPEGDGGHPHLAVLVAHALVRKPARAIAIPADGRPPLPAPGAVAS